MGLLNYMQINYAQILALLAEHIELTVISVGLAILIGVPLGIFIAYLPKVGKSVMSLANVIQAIPSMALLGFMIPFLGIGSVPAVVAVVLYSLLPIIKNTYTGIQNINPQTVEAATGIGLTPFQVLTKIQIPMALPVIMAGVRIASVTAVGLMTIASFIGAGGLGFMVFSGIRTVNNEQILAGAIPACMLALFVDLLVGSVEKLVTPISLQNNGKGNKNRWFQKVIVFVSVIAIIAIFAFTFMSREKVAERSIAIGSKNFTEQAIVGNMVADYIEAKTDISVQKKLMLGGTQVCFGALKKGDIDMYVEYTGTAYSDTLKHPPISDIEKVYNSVKDEFKSLHGVEVLKQMGFNNTYVLAIREDTSKQYGIKTLSDFAKVGHKMKIGTVFEFANREDGLKGLQKKYNFKIGSFATVEGGARYTAIDNKNVDVISAFSTDGLLKKFNLITLKDDKSFFPPYYAIPIIREDTLKKYPEIKECLEDLSEVLTDEVMRELNYQVDELHKKPADVAKEYLLKQKLID
ncbi:MAG: glycine betaine ABC transporter substrate-binding protein [Synergistaceae bacterium]